MAHKPLGADAQGRHAYQGGRTDIHAPGPVHHTYGEVPQTTRSGLGREGGKPKGYPIHVHGGQTHRDGGTVNTGISRTASASALQGGKLPTNPPVVAKRLPIPRPNSGTPSRAERGVFDPNRANKVMSEAVLSGSTKLPDSTSEST